MNFSLFWKLSIFVWCNIIIFLCLVQAFITVFISPCRAKEAKLPIKSNILKTSNQKDINNPLENNSNVDNVELEETNSLRSDVFKEDFDKRINTLKDELNINYTDSLSDLPSDVEETFFTYDEKEQYTPDLYDGESGVEIITDAYEKRIEDRLS